MNWLDDPIANLVLLLGALAALFAAMGWLGDFAARKLNALLGDNDKPAHVARRERVGK